ncbi:MAG: lysozyme [Patescibacteria group bacterium]
MKISQTGINLIEKFEGCKLETYKCSANVNTIGYGTTKNIVLGMKISLQQAEELLKKDLIYFENAVNKNVKIKLNQNQFDALVSFTYNLGEGNLKSSTLLKLINSNKILEASKEFVRWNKANGKVLTGLTRRREAERELFIKLVF